MLPTTILVLTQFGSPKLPLASEVCVASAEVSEQEMIKGSSTLAGSMSGTSSVYYHRSEPAEDTVSGLRTRDDGQVLSKPKGNSLSTAKVEVVEASVCEEVAEGDDGGGGGGGNGGAGGGGGSFAIGSMVYFSASSSFIIIIVICPWVKLSNVPVFAEVGQPGSRCNEFQGSRLQRRPCNSSVEQRK
jgi:hypothetical protein